jgi:hypothetical protein
MSVIPVTPLNLSNSSMLPTQTTSSKSSLVQSGIGVPQYRFLEIAQSLAFSNQFANRFS